MHTHVDDLIHIPLLISHYSSDLQQCANKYTEEEG